MLCANGRFGVPWVVAAVALVQAMQEMCLHPVALRSSRVASFSVIAALLPKWPGVWPAQAGTAVEAAGLPLRSLSDTHALSLRAAGRCGQRGQASGRSLLPYLLGPAVVLQVGLGFGVRALCCKYLITMLVSAAAPSGACSRTAEWAWCHCKLPGSIVSVPSATAASRGR